MGTRTVRLDDESERLLGEVRRLTGASVSDALKRGLVALRDSARADAPERSPFEIYEGIDLGPGGYARARARRAKAAVAKLLRAKARR
jgi:hypothetical protein